MLRETNGRAHPHVRPLAVPHPFAPGGLADELEATPANDDALDPLPLVYGPELAAPLAPTNWLCRELYIAPGRVTLLSAAGGIGKTMLAQQMELVIASGGVTMWGSAAVSAEGPIVHFDYEQTFDITRARYQRLAHSLNVDLAALGDRIALCSMPPMYLPDPRAEDEFTRVCDGRTLAVIDNLRAACPGVDENSSEVRRYLDLCTKVTNRTGCVVMVLVHEGKPSADPAAPARGPRGSSGILDATQQVISLSCTNGVIRIEGGKTNMGPRPEPLYVRFVDEGETHPATGQSVGLAVEWLPPEQAAELAAGGKPTAVALRIRRDVLETLKKHGPMPKRRVREYVTGKNDLIDEALSSLLRDGTVCLEPGARGATVYRLAAAVA